MTDTPPDRLTEIGVLERGEIMEGAPHCDFRFVRGKPPAA